MSQSLQKSKNFRNFVGKLLTHACASRYTKNKMKKLSFLLLAAAMLAACSRGTMPEAEYPLKDSITEVVTRYLVAEQVDCAMAVIDSAEAAGALSHISAEIARAHVWSSDEATLAEVQPHCAPLLEQNLTPDERTELLGLLIYAARQRDDDAHLLEYGKLYIDICRQMGSTVPALVTQAEIGEVLIRLGRTDEGTAMTDNAIAELDGVKAFAALDAGIRTKKAKIRSLIDRQHYDEAIPYCRSIITCLKDYEAQPEVYADGSERLPGDDRRPGYIDFYTGQAYAFMAYAYASLGELDKARESCRLFEQTDHSRTFTGKQLISSTWYILDEYDRLLPFYDELQARWGDDTLHNDFAIMLENRALIADERGNKKQSAGYWRRLCSLQKQLNDAERLAAAQETAARFHEQEQQYALEQAHAQKRRITRVAVTLATGIVMIALFVIILLLQLRTIRRKNDVLSQEIAENVRFKEQYYALNDLGEQTDEHKDEASQPSLDEMTDAELFEYLRKIIVGEKLYLDPKFGRQMLMDRFRLRKERIGAAFSRGSSYGSLPAFVSECRLTKSVMLLQEQPTLSVADIATACGYANTTTFLINFKQRYSLTPTEFRNQKSYTQESI